MRFKHIIWDYDGTLFDTYPAMAEAFRDALLERGISEPADEIMSLMKISMREARAHYTGRHSLDDTFFERFEELRGCIEIEKARPFDGVVDLCNAVCKQGGKNYLFTHRGKSAVKFMEQYGLLVSFTELITEERNFANKPSPEAVLHLMFTHGFSGDEAIMVGDRDIDVLSAQNAGIHSCYFSSHSEKSSIAEYSAESVAELLGIFGISTGA